MYVQSFHRWKPATCQLFVLLLPAPVLSLQLLHFLQLLLDYRCYVNGNQLRNVYPPSVRMCMQHIAAMSIPDVLTHFQLPCNRTATVLHRRATGKPRQTFFTAIARVCMQQVYVCRKVTDTLVYLDTLHSATFHEFCMQTCFFMATNGLQGMDGHRTTLERGV